MLKFIDHWLEKKIQKKLHQRRKKIIDKTLSIFKKQHPDLDTTEFVKNVNKELDRVYAIVDRSILRERIQRAKITFWITAILGILLVGLLGGFSGGTAIPFIAPLTTALATWVISIATIPISYNQRIKGAMDSLIIAYEKSLEIASPTLKPNPKAAHLINFLKDEKKAAEIVLGNDDVEYFEKLFQSKEKKPDADEASLPCTIHISKLK